MRDLEIRAMKQSDDPKDQKQSDLRGESRFMDRARLSAASRRDVIIR